MADQHERSPSWEARKVQQGRRAYLIYFERGLERLVDQLKGWAIFEILELVGRLSVLAAVVFWFLEIGDRQKEKHYRAWELINSARGSAGDGGRRDALQDLNEDGVLLTAAPLSKAYLSGVRLPKAVLTSADLFGANLGNADLSGANL